MNLLPERDQRSRNWQTLVTTLWAVLVASTSQASLLISQDNDRFVAIDPLTAATTFMPDPGAPPINSLTYDRNHDILYATSIQSLQGTTDLRSVDFPNGATSYISSIHDGSSYIPFIHAIEYNPDDDTLYAISSETDLLYRVNVATGLATIIGPTGLPFAMGMAYDFANNIMYVSNSDIFDPSPNGLFTIDLATGVTSSVGLFENPGQITGLAFDPELGLYGTDNLAGFGANSLYRISTTTGEATLVGDLGFGNYLGLTFVPEPNSGVLVMTGLVLRAVFMKRHRPIRVKNKSESG